MYFATPAYSIPSISSSFFMPIISIDIVHNYFSKTSKPTRNLVLLNLIGASLSDEFYSVEEHFLIEKIQES
ncbi:MAG: hypothetical protein PHN29_06385, partial [Endomicrobiaceae bacterium]|nr:hypothetical protein [Endomicrobiaceae bacterium]